MDLKCEIKDRCRTGFKKHKAPIPDNLRKKTLTTTIYKTGDEICLSLVSMIISIENDITIKCKDYTEAGPPIFRDELDSCLPSDFAKLSETTGEGTLMLISDRPT